MLAIDKGSLGRLPCSDAIDHPGLWPELTIGENNCEIV